MWHTAPTSRPHEYHHFYLEENDYILILEWFSHCIFVWLYLELLRNTKEKLDRLIFNCQIWTFPKFNSFHYVVIKYSEYAWDFPFPFSRLKCVFLIQVFFSICICLSDLLAFQLSSDSSYSICLYFLSLTGRGIWLKALILAHELPNPSNRRSAYQTQGRFPPHVITTVPPHHSCHSHTKPSSRTKWNWLHSNCFAIPEELHRSCVSYKDGGQTEWRVVTWPDLLQQHNVHTIACEREYVRSYQIKRKHFKSKKAILNAVSLMTLCCVHSKRGHSREYCTDKSWVVS